MERSLGFVAVQPRNETITIPAEARRALRLDLPGAQVEVILRDNDLVLGPHVAVRLDRVRDDGTAPAAASRAGSRVRPEARARRGSRQGAPPRIGGHET